MDLNQEFSRWLHEHPGNPVWMSGHGTRFACPEPMMIVSAPLGIESFVPEEMTVTCGAGTSVDELQVILGEHGQYVNLPVRTQGSGTVGGALGMGEGDVFRLGRGSVRDVLLQAKVMRSSGELIKVGGPTVKNVSGFDLCRLLVGSCGRLGFIVEVILRTRPKPMATRWVKIESADWSTVSLISRQVHRPSSLLWSGHDVYICLEGHPEDLAETCADLSRLLSRPVSDAEPSLEDFGYRWVCSPTDMTDVVSASPGECLAEIGTGVVHHRNPPPVGCSDPVSREIESRLLETFDPGDRLNGGSRIWGQEYRRPPLMEGRETRK